MYKIVQASSYHSDALWGLRMRTSLMEAFASRSAQRLKGPEMEQSHAENVLDLSEHSLYWSHPAPVDEDNEVALNIDIQNSPDRDATILATFLTNDKTLATGSFKISEMLAAMDRYKQMMSTLTETDARVYKELVGTPIVMLISNKTGHDILDTDRYGFSTLENWLTGAVMQPVAIHCNPKFNPNDEFVITPDMPEMAQYFLAAPGRG